MLRHRSLVLVALALALSVPLTAQVQPGTPAFGSYAGGPEAINLANLNAHWTIPVLHKPGRGTNFTYDLIYDSSVWYPALVNGHQTWQPVANYGWASVTEVFTGQLSYQTVNTSSMQIYCGPTLGYVTEWTYTYGNWTYIDQFGRVHAFSGTTEVISPYGCTPGQSYVTGMSATTNDGSGYSISVNGDCGPSMSCEAISSDGTYYQPPVVVNGTAKFTDRNGNELTADGSGHFYDTLSSSNPVLTVSGAGTVASPLVFTYTPSNPSSSKCTSTNKSGVACYAVNYTNYTVATNFGNSTIGEYKSTAAVPLVTSIVLPDNSLYTFTYESTPGTCTPYSGTTCVTARIKTVTIPTGATITYGYLGGNNGILGDGSTATLSRQTPDGTWTYAQAKGAGAASTTTVTDPTSGQNQTVIQFQGIYETERQIYQGSTSGTLQQTINTCYNAATSPCVGTAITLPITQRTAIATIPGSGNLQSKQTQKFDSIYGNLIETDEYDFSATSSFTLLRQTLTTYTTPGSSLNAFPQTVKVLDGSGNIKSRQDLAYDSYGSGMTCVTSAPQHDNTNYGCSMTARGNATSTTVYTDPVTPGGAITRNFTYDSTGNLLTAQLSCCQMKTWAYSSTTGFAYPDSVTSGSSSPQLIVSMTYDLNMGLTLTNTDPNNVKTTMTYDNIGRIGSSQTGSLPAANYTYNDYDNHASFTPWTAKVCGPIQGTNTVCQNSIFDKLGRITTVQLLDGSGTLYSATDTQYDSLGRAYKTSNPYTGSASYWTQLGFDVLGRLTSSTLPDNSVSAVSYTDNTGTTTDPTGKQRKSVADGLGRLTSIYEPDPSNNNSLTVQTSYAYNVFDGLTSVTQGSQSRTFTYDALGRLTSSTTPEAGMVCIGTVSGGVCQANTGYDSWGNLIARTDARGVVTNYLYDSLNRLSGVTYPTVPTGVGPMPNNCKANGSSSNNAYVCINYGTSAANYNNGRIASMYDGVGSETYMYDQYGNVTQLAKVVASTTYPISYAYNLAGELTQITYPSGRVIQQSVDAVGRLCEIAPSTTGCGTASSPYATGFGYNVASQLTGFKYGNGVYASLGFSADRLQLSCLDYSTTNRSGTCAHDGTTKFGLTYAYGTSGSNNGQIASITDYVDNGRTITYTYDSLYRLATAATSGSSGYPQWGLSWTYDRYGNSQSQNQTAGSPPHYSVSVSPTTNRITTSGFTYDANGNVTGDGLDLNTISYDGENHAVSSTNGSSSGGYVYDGNGYRVKKCLPNCTSPTAITIYIYSGPKVIAEYPSTASPSSPSREYIYAGGALITSVNGSGIYQFYHQDHLSNRLVTSISGGTLEQLGHYPFGETWYNTANDKWQFTSYERDSESGNDYAMDRTYVNRLGRFSSVDPVGGDVSNPQSLNAYTYALNDPINLYDPTGDDPQCACSDYFYSLTNPECANVGGSPGMNGGGGGEGSSQNPNLAALEGEGPRGQTEFELLELSNQLANTVMGWQANPECPYPDDCPSGEDPLIPVYGEPFLVAGQIGQPSTASGTDYHSWSVSVAVLKKCISQLFNIELRTFTPAMAVSNGTFYGLTPSGMGVSVESDVQKYNSIDLSYKSGTEGTIGLTLKSQPNLNYIARDANFFESFEHVQVHELAHSLAYIKTGKSNEGDPKRLMDCIDQAAQK